MTPPSDNPKVLFGTAGWSYPDWNGFVYPKGFSGGRLGFMIDFVDLIEINTSFYRPVDPRSSEIWAKRALNKPGFVFTAKLWQKFTHERGAIEPLDVRTFLDGLAPLIEADVFDALLMQFPWSFRRSEKNMMHLERLKKAFGKIPLAVEVRHVSWNDPQTLDFLKERDMAFVNLDQPMTGDNLKPSSHVTAPFAYVRMHGRNERDWFRNDAERDDRYNYLYETSELMPWTDRLKEMEEKAGKIYVVMNNHFKGQALANSIELKHLYTGSKQTVPDPMFAPYPRIASIAQNPPAQIELF